MIHSYFKIEILVIRDEFVTPGHKRLKELIQKIVRKGERVWLFGPTVYIYFAHPVHECNKCKLAIAYI